MGVLGIDKDCPVVKKLVLNTRIEAFWYANFIFF